MQRSRKIAESSKFRHKTIWLRPKSILLNIQFIQVDNVKTRLKSKKLIYQMPVRNARKHDATSVKISFPHNIPCQIALAYPELSKGGTTFLNLRSILMAVRNYLLVLIIFVVDPYPYFFRR